MAKSLIDLVAAIRQLANVENNPFVTDVEIRDRLNEAKQDLYDLIVDVASGAYAKQADPVTLAGGVGGNLISLPSDFYRMKGVDRTPGSSSVETVRPLASFAERNDGGRYWDLVGNSQVAIVRPEFAAGVYQLWYYPIANLLFDPTIVVTTGDNAIAHNWTFANAKFDQSYVGGVLTVAGTVQPFNTGSFTINQIVSTTTIVTLGTGGVGETFNPANVTVAAQPANTEFVLDAIMAPWSLYLELHSARGILAKREMDTGDLAVRLEAQRQRVTAAARHRRGAPQQVPLVRRRTGWRDGGCQ